MENPVDLAERLYGDGKLEDARVLLERAVLLPGLRARAMSDLGVLAASEGDVALALRWFEDALRADPRQRAAALNLFDLLEPLGESARAEPFLQRAAASLCGDAEIVERLARLEARHAGQPRLAFLAAGEADPSAGELLARLCGDFCVRSVVSRDPLRLQEAAAWADVVWIESAVAIALPLTRRCDGLERKRIVCRVPAREVFAPELQQIDWRRISDLVFSAEHVRRIALARAPQIAREVGRIHVVPHGIDPERFPLAQRPRGRQLAFVGDLEFEKGPMLLLQAFAALAARDPGWRLHVAGALAEPRHELYLRQFVEAQGLRDRVVLCGRVEDTAAWLADKDFAVSSSLLEGQPVALLEALACGLKPLIHEFVGARELYPPEFLWRTVDQFVRRAEAPDFERSGYREFVLRRYTSAHQAQQTLALLGKGSWSEPEVGPAERGRLARVGEGPREPEPEQDAASRVRLEPERLHASPRQERIKQRLRELIAPRDSVLDLGCGLGATTGFIRSLGVRDLLGVDLAPERIASARRAHPEIEFRVADIPRLDCGRSFDFIVLADLVSQVPAGRRAELFEMLARHSHADTLVWMSLPDPDRVEPVREQESAHLPIAEGAVQMRELLAHAEQSGFRLVSFASFGIEVPFERCEYLWARGAKPARRAP